MIVVRMIQIAIVMLLVNIIFMMTVLITVNGSRNHNKSRYENHWRDSGYK